MITLLIKMKFIVISSLNKNISVNPYSVTKNLVLLKYEISKLFADLVNLSFLSGVFPSTLNITTEVPVFQNNF